MAQNEGLTGHLQDKPSDLPGEQAPDPVRDMLAGLAQGDEIEIERVAPLSHKGYLCSIPMEHGIDLKDEVQRSFWGGTYFCKCKRRGPDGRYHWVKGSARFTIAGPPKPINYEPERVTQPAVYQPPPPPPFAAAELQSRLLDIISERLKTPQEQLGDVARQIGEVIHGGQAAAASSDPLESMLKAMETYKRMEKLMGRGEERRRNPEPDDEEDDEDDLGTDTGLVNVLGKMFMRNMIPQQQSAPQMAQDGPPGWRKMPDGQWVRVTDDAPPGWQKMPDGQWVRTEQPPPMGGYRDAHGNLIGARAPRDAPVYRDAQGDLVDAQGRRADVRPSPTEPRTWPQKMRDKDPRGTDESWRRHARQPWPASTAQAKEEVSEVTPTGQDIDPGFGVLVDPVRGVAVETVPAQNDRIANPGEPDSNGSGSGEEDEPFTCPHCGSEDVDEVVGGDCWQCFACKETFDGPDNEAVPLNEATPEAIADEIENMDEDEQLLTLELLAKKFNLPVELVREFVKNTQAEKAGQA